MTDNYLGEIRVFPFKLVPKGWALCNGAVLPIQGNQALFSLISNIYGGDGKTTFALPDLRGRTPVDMVPGTSSPYPIGGIGGIETETLAIKEMPAHNHVFSVYNGLGNLGEPNDILAIPHDATNAGVQVNIYNPSVKTSVTLNANSVSTVGGNQPHDNMQPFLTLNFCIATEGVYPPRP